MQYRKLGESDLEVSVIGYGAWGIGGPPFWTEKDEKESIAAIHAALDCGINLIDTAPVYGFGRSEEIVGKAIEGRRDKVIVATKCGLRWKEEELKGIYRNLGPASLYEEVEASLRRMKVDYIDLYQIHWPDENTPVEHALVGLFLLQKMGKIRHIGVSNFSVEQMKEAIEFGPVVSLQPKYNLLEREIEAGELPVCRDNDIGVLAYSPLASGLLSGKYGKGDTFDGWRKKGGMGIFKKKSIGPALDKVEKLKAFAGERGTPLSHMAIKWVIDQPGVTSALVGANTVEQVESNAKAADYVLTVEDAGKLEELAG